MATNNYFGFTHGGTQYGASGTGAAYQAGQTGYAVASPATAAAAAAASYGTQRAATGYDAAYQTAAAGTPGTYAAVGGGATPAYEYGYGQTPSAAYSGGYEAGATSTVGKPATYAAAFAQRSSQQQSQATVAAKPTQYSAAFQANAAGYQAAPYGQQAAQTTIAAQPTTQAKQANSVAHYSGYDAALYSAATMYVAQQGAAVQQKVGYQGFKKGGLGGKNIKSKAPPKPQQLHYCDVCKISCAGPQTYREHLEGQKHKKREAATKMTASIAVTNQNRSGLSLRCQLCDVTCTGNDAYAAHIRGSKHQKVILLHTKLGKPIPSQDPEVLGSGGGSGSAGASGTSAVRKLVAGTPKINFVQAGNLSSGPTSGATGAAGNGDNGKEDETDEPSEPDIQPVGQDYIEEMKSDDGKLISFNCKLCECRFNDPNAKEMHMKGRRHRLQYKKKVNPDLVVDVKPSLRLRKMQERRTAAQEEFWARRHFNMVEDEEDRMFWKERRRMGEEYMDMCRRGSIAGPFVPRGRPPFPPNMGPPFFQGGGMPMGRRVDSTDDRHVMAHHAEIYPKEEELQAIQRIVSHTECAIKIVSEQLSDTNNGKSKEEGTKTATTTDENNSKTTDTEQNKEDGCENQLSSAADRDQNLVLRGVTRVGLLAKGLLLHDDKHVELVVSCAEKPTLTLLRNVVEMLPNVLKQMAPDNNYNVTMNAPEAGLTVSGDGLTVLAQLTCSKMRDQEAASDGLDRDVLARDKCLQALAALRHTKWFQARALGLHSCVVIIRILRDLCQRVPTWSPLSSWAIELLAEKVMSSGGMLSVGEALRRIMEAVASGILLPGGPGLVDPCERDNPDATVGLLTQQREDLTCSAQYALRLIAYRQIYKVLGMDPLPVQQKLFRKDRPGRKRRRSGGEPADSEGDGGKMVKTDVSMTDVGNTDPPAK